ncbi:MAG: phosphoribosylanthranilate isomerase, partial [Micrococcaceae bacterium]
MFIKICGLKTLDDVRVVRETGADAMGVVLSQTSPRAVSQETARELIAEGTPELTTVLVVHDLSIDDVIAAAQATGVDVVQLHGYSEQDVRRASEELPRVWRAASIDHGRLDVGALGEEALLLDSATPGS